MKVIGVRFKPVGKIYYFSPAGMDIAEGGRVVVETARGVELGNVVLGVHEIDEERFTKPLKDVIRVATEEDLQHDAENRQREKEAFAICAEKIKKHNLPMKLIEAEYTFDGSKLLFYFSSEGRVDFRELVKDLATVFRTRIELRQIGIRDESKILGSIGICGRELCCSKFLNEFESVSIKMAKEQGLSLNPTKISGNCGRLMCCLNYEQKVYEDLLRTTPSQGSVVMTPQGRGTVEYVSLLKGKVKVKIENDKESALAEFDVRDIKMPKKSKNRDFIEKKDEEILKSLED